jgi:DNA-binding response OmpR family regulator
MLQGEGEKAPPAPLPSMTDGRATIMVVEDHAATRRFLADNLAADGFATIEADGTGAARRLLRTEYPDLAIIDLALPDGDGLDLIQAVRDADASGSGFDPELPMIVLSGRSRELELLRGFRRGCDDYLAKPFSYPELHARITALLRRMRRRANTQRIRIGPLTIDPLARQVWVGERELALSQKEFALLRLLASEPTHVFTREQLLREIWGYQLPVPHTRTLDSHAFRLRRKLGRAGVALVVNVWGVGYRLHDGTLSS